MVRVIHTADLGGDYLGEDAADGWVYEKPAASPKSVQSKPCPSPATEAVTPFKLCAGKPISNSKKGLK